jgi:phosphonate metabolism protein PhnN/1,5-bisphosphokinase (PRPP-forming)
MTNVSNGLLVLVVGPSGVGKDTLIDAARSQLRSDKRFVFCRRCITRPANAIGEAHIPIAPDDFAPMARQGSFVLSWQAHGLCYGIPAHVENEVRGGRTIIVNGSRSVIDDARALFGPDQVRVINITANEDALRDRLAARGRESHVEIERRIARAAAYDVTGPNVIHIDNGGDLQSGIRAFLAAIVEPVQSAGFAAQPNLAAGDQPIKGGHF